MEKSQSQQNRLNLDPTDSCGVGFIANIRNRPSHKVLQLGTTALANVVHRGAIAADGRTGDGCGISTNFPETLVSKWRVESGDQSDGLVGVGVLFLPLADSQRDAALGFIRSTIQSLGMNVTGPRIVPVNEDALGKQAFDARPHIVQIFITAATEDPDLFERRLFIARRTIELSPLFAHFDGLHIASMSCHKLVYKAMVQSVFLAEFYPDLQDPDFRCSVCVYHQRFSTNTSPTWSLCQPFRMLAHNGEINTIRGNRNWMTARESSFEHEYWNEHRNVIQRLFNFRDSDSASLDNCVELLALSGRSLPHVINMLIPPAWENDPRIPDLQKAFYEYHSCFCEPWDGPAAVVAFDGKAVTATLDRNGLRPLRFKIASNDLLMVGSEVGADREPLEQFVDSGRLGPGQTIAFELQRQKIVYDHELKDGLAQQQPYADWLSENCIAFVSKTTNAESSFHADSSDFLRRQIAAGVAKEEIEISLKSMAQNGKEPIFSMGVDTPLAVLSRQPRNIADFFKQRFAQVTNPPIDSIRERSGMSLNAGLGPERNLLAETPVHSRVVTLENPVLLPNEFEDLKASLPFPSQTLDCTWPKSAGSNGLKHALERLVSEARMAVERQHVVLVLSDRAVNEERIAIPMLLAVGAIHHGLNKSGQRMMCSLIAETSDVRDSHQLALLFGYGCTAAYPYLAFGSIERLHVADHFTDESLEGCWKNYRDALSDGVLKIMAKMGISVLYSYQGAQIFEAVGIGQEVIDMCFKYSYSNIEGVGFEEFAANRLLRHSLAYDTHESDLRIFEPGISKPKRAGEHHVINGKVTKPFHQFVRQNGLAQYDEFRDQVETENAVSIRDLLVLPIATLPIELKDVEPVEAIRRRFTTAAMSLGAISPEAHEALAIAMNAIGGKSNSGEGGEDPRRFQPLADGTWSNSKIKQVASGRFGVNIGYLQSAEEIEIKMAQGAKPGEGGQLPGFKVNELIGRLRNTAPGVTLISPPPHHDIYSIEDLAQLIYDLKLVNPSARVCVKLVAKSGVGGIAVGVVKALADVVLISGHEGGTGASPLTSIKHAGLPWELGLAESHQNLVASGLRDQVIVRADGGIRTGIDVVKAAMLGAEEFNFGTMALIALGCVYVKKCHLNNCPVGIATQDPKYRSKFKGKPENLINYFNAVAEECREILASMGVRSLDEVIGRADLFSVSQTAKDRDICLRSIVGTATTSHRPTVEKYDSPPNSVECFDEQIMAQVNWCGHRVIKAQVVNTDRNIGTRLSSELTQRQATPACSINLELEGSAGQSLGAFLVDGIDIQLVGEANDYVGKGMSGGRVVLRPNASLSSKNPVIAGNAILYGATGGTFYAAGVVAERFCVRNSGAVTVVEGCGDHGCEYMTRGTAVVLGTIGNNFAAGMTGGEAFVFDESNLLTQLCNLASVELHTPSATQLKTLYDLVRDFAEVTDSVQANRILQDWETERSKFVLVAPQPAVAGSVVPKKQAVAAEQI